MYAQRLNFLVRNSFARRLLDFVFGLIGSLALIFPQSSIAQNSDSFYDIVAANVYYRADVTSSCFGYGCVLLIGFNQYSSEKIVCDHIANYFLSGMNFFYQAGFPVFTYGSNENTSTYGRGGGLNCGLMYKDVPTNGTAPIDRNFSVNVKLYADCPVGYSYNKSTAASVSANHVGLGDCRKAKPCETLDAMSCTMQVASGGAGIPSTGVIHGCHVSVSVGTCQNVITRTGNSYVQTSYCNTTLMPTGGASGANNLTCLSTTPNQNLCDLPGANCENNSEDRQCPGGFILTNQNTCVQDTDGDGEPDDGSCPAGYHRPKPVGGVVGACVADQGSGGDGGNGGTGGTGGNGGNGGSGSNGDGARKEDVKCGATGALCESKFDNYWDWFKETLGIEAADKAHGQTVRAQAQGGAFDTNSLNDGPVTDLSGSIESGSIVGSGCPAPRFIPVFGSSLTISFQPFCDLASILGPLFFLISLVVAARILSTALESK